MGSVVPSVLGLITGYICKDLEFGRADLWVYAKIKDLLLNRFSSNSIPSCSFYEVISNKCIFSIMKNRKIENVCIFKIISISFYFESFVLLLFLQKI